MDATYPPTACALSSCRNEPSFYLGQLDGDKGVCENHVIAAIHAGYNVRVISS